MTSENYEITETLSEDTSLTLYRGIRRKDGAPVLIKTPNSGAAPEHPVNLLRREYEILRQLPTDFVLQPRELDEFMGQTCLILEHFDGSPLSAYLDSPLEPLSFLDIAIQLSSALADIHHRHVVHRDLRPGNVLFDPKSGKLKLTGFGAATTNGRGSTSLSAASVLEGSLDYISPEQTGRMNRPVDYRTDFYSLGVALYRMLTARLPFNAKDALGQIHCHIAAVPVPPRELNPAIPLMVARVVLKLLSKMADDRYQSAQGLLEDLQLCRHELEQTGSISEFEVGLRDFSETLQIPHKLFGREQETQQLSAIFNQACSGNRELLLIAGYSGVGKTALVKELSRTTAQASGHFIEGKFDQLQKNVPYSAWIQAFGALANTLLMGSEEQIVDWRDAILGALGSIGRVLTELIPNLELIVGPQPAIPTLEPAESLNRVNYAFVGFVQALATQEHPLVVFLDDLQWIDAASLNLMQTLSMHPDISHIVIIGAYRDNDVDAAHPLSVALDSLQNEGVEFKQMALGEISETAVNALISKTLRSTPEGTEPLTHLLYSKTGGNPFFLLQTLKALAERKALTIDPESRCWKWEMSQLATLAISDNVASLMLGNIQRLSPETREALCFAACIGFRFSPSTLGTILGKSEEATLDVLRAANNEGLIVHFDSDLRFAHDRIQQAAYSLIPDDEKKEAHLKIGRQLKDSMPLGGEEENLFTVVDHMNIGSKLIDTDQERLALAHLNLRAGLKAKASAAFFASAEYLQSGERLLREEDWNTHYELALEIFTQAAQTASLTGSFERTSRLFDIVVENAASPLDMIGAYMGMLTAYSAQGRLPEFMDCALEVLERLDVHIEPHPTPAYIMQTIAEVRSCYDPSTIGTLTELRATDDPRMKQVTRVLDLAQNSAYSGRPDLFALFALEGTRRTLLYGTTPESMHFFAHYSLLLLGLPGGDISEGYAFGMVAKSLAEDAERSAIALMVEGTVSGMVWPYMRPLKETLDMLKPLYAPLTEVGEFEYAGYIRCWYCCNGLLSGTNLVRLEREMAAANADIIHIRAEIGRLWQTAFWQTALNLIGPVDEPWIVDGKAYAREPTLRLIVETGNLAAQTALHVNTLTLCYLFERYEEAREASELIEKCRSGMVAMPIEPMWFFYDSLVRLALYAGASDAEKRVAMERVAANQTYLEQRARYAPMNFLNKWHLVEAERERALGNDLMAMEHFDRAIFLARESGVIQEEALANELTAKFWAARKKSGFARAHMERAYRAYRSWGAMEKARALEKGHPYLLLVGQRDEHLSTSSSLDIKTIIETAQAISGEMDMGRLLEKVIESAMENAGARLAFLLMERGGVWRIVLRKAIGKEREVVHVPVELAQSDEVASGVVHFVSRSKQTVVLENAAEHGNFVNEPVVVARKSKSILCAPLLSSGRLTGILYLENDLLSGAFTSQRVSLLDVILSEAATSIESATVYEELKESEFRYRQIVETAYEGVWVLAPSANILSVNSRMAEMLGYPAEEIVGRPQTAFIPEEDRADLDERMERLRRGISEPYRCRFLRKDGRTVWSLVSAAPIFDAEKRYNGSFAMITDITEQKNAEDSLRKSEALLSAVQRISKVGGWEYDIKTGKAFWTEELYRIHEMPSDPGIDHVAESKKCYGAEDADILIAAFHRACTHGEAYDFELPFTTLKGNHLWVRTTARPVYEEGQLVRLIGNLVDITERKKAEERIRALNASLEKMVVARTKQLAGANKELEAFALSVSHDLRAPIRHINGFVDLLVSRCREELDEKALHYLETIADSSRRMGVLVDELLRFSRTGRVEMQHGRVDMRRILDEVLRELQHDHADRRIEWLIGELPSVRCDQDLIRQVWVNLLENAVKYSRVRKDARIEVSAERKKDEVVFSVADNGVGFDMQYAGKLFGVFQRLHSQSEFEGVGIGLAMVHRIVDRHGGRVWADGRVNEGATFYFAMPVNGAIDDFGEPRGDSQEPSGKAPSGRGSRTE